MKQYGGRRMQEEEINSLQMEDYIVLLKFLKLNEFIFQNSFLMTIQSIS